MEKANQIVVQLKKEGVNLVSEQVFSQESAKGDLANAKTLSKGIELPGLVRPNQSNIRDAQLKGLLQCNPAK